MSLLNHIRERIRAGRARAALHRKHALIAGEAAWPRPRFEMSLCGGRDQVAHAACANGWQAFERPTPAYFSRAVQAAGQGFVIDVGANTGFYTLLALSVSDTVSIVAYEPLAPVRAILAHNVHRNRARGRVCIVADAVSDTDGEGTLHIPDDQHRLIETSASLSADFKQDIMARQRVAIRRLDTRHLAGARVAVIKIDAESHDLAVLRGAEGLLLRHRPIVFVEVLLGADEAGLAALLTRCGYNDVVLFEEGASAPRNTVVHETRAWNHMWVPQEQPGHRDSGPRVDIAGDGR